MNLDSWPGVHPDLVMDATAPWPFPDGSAAAVYLGQVVEHLAWPRGVRAALAEAARVLAGDGSCLVVCPDFAAFDEKRVEPWIVDNERRGARRWPGDRHRWCPTRHVVGAELCRHFAWVRAVNPLNVTAPWPPGERQPWDCAYLAGHSSPPAIA